MDSDNLKSAGNTVQSKNELLQEMIDTTELKMCGRHMISLLDRWAKRMRRYEEDSNDTKDSDLIQIVAAQMLFDIDAVLNNLRNDVECLHKLNVDDSEYSEPEEDEFAPKSQLLDYLEILKLPEPLALIYSSLVWATKAGDKVGEMTGPLRGAKTGSGRKRDLDGFGLMSVQVKAVVAIDLLISDHNYSEIKAADKVAKALAKGGFDTSDKKAGEKITGDAVKRWRKKVKDPFFSQGVSLFKENLKSLNEHLTEKEIFDYVRFGVLDARIVLTV